MTKYLTKLILLFILHIHSLLFAQGGREFWFAAPEVSSLHGDRPVVLRISSFSKPAQITVSQPSNPGFITITQTIDSNSFTSIDLTSQIDLIETKPANKVLNSGLLIESTADINAYYEVLGAKPSGLPQYNNAEIFLLKGNNALGTLFYVPMQTEFPNRDGLDAWASFDIVASENNTQINITPSKTILGHGSGKPFTIILNRGETYSCRAISVNPEDRPTGTKIVSDKPISITYKDDSIFKGSNWDLVGDQILPVSELGLEYIAVRNSGSYQPTPAIRSDYVFFVATENNTKVYIKNDSIILNEAENASYRFDDTSIYIRSDKPISMLHLSGFANELGCANLLPLQCTGSKSYQFVRTTRENFSLNLIVRTGGETNFKLNGVSRFYDPTQFKSVPGTSNEWQYIRLPLSLTVISLNLPYKITNSTSDFNLCFLSGGDNTSFRYGYFSGFGHLNIGPDKFLCKNQTIDLDAGPNKNSYLWNTGENTQVISVKDSGTYYAVTTKGVCEFKDTLQVKFNPENTQPILGNDTSACADQLFSISTISKFKSYLWQGSATTETYKLTQSGKYSVQVSDSNGCIRNDSLFFTSYPLPVPKIVWDNNEERFCNDSLFTFSLSSSFKTISWFNGANTVSVTSSRNEKDNYSVNVKNDSGCSGSDSITIDCSAYISIPNIFTPNGDSYNESFRVKNLKKDLWRMQIYGRWGTTVYNSDSYNNDWKGEGQPDGVYFYLLKNKESNKEYKGTVEILR